MTTSVLQFIKINHGLQNGQAVRIVDYGKRDFFDLPDSSTATALFTRLFYCRVNDSSTVTLYDDSALTVLAQVGEYNTSINLVPLNPTAGQSTSVAVSFLGITYPVSWINTSNVTITWSNYLTSNITWINTI